MTRLPISISFGLSLAVSGVSMEHIGTAHAANPIATKEGNAFSKLYRQGQRAIRENQLLAPRLLAILENEKESTDHRVAAGQILSEMRYLPAIPALVRNIHLMPTVASESTAAPLHIALGRFGNAAIPPIIDEIMKRDVSWIRRRQWKTGGVFAFFLAIDRFYKLPDNTYRTARLYASGVAATTRDGETGEKVKAFLKELDYWESDNESIKRKRIREHRKLRGLGVARKRR